MNSEMNKVEGDWTLIELITLKQLQEIPYGHPLHTGHHDDMFIYSMKRVYDTLFGALYLPGAKNISSVRVSKSPLISVHIQFGHGKFPQVID